MGVFYVIVIGFIDQFHTYHRPADLATARVNKQLMMTVKSFRFIFISRGSHEMYISFPVMIVIHNTLKS